MHEVKAFIRPQRTAAVVEALHELSEMPGITVSTNIGYGRSSAGQGVAFGQTEITKIETVVSDELLPQVLEAIQRVGATGRPGDGKIFVTRVEQAIRIRSGESGAQVL